MPLASRCAVTGENPSGSLPVSAPYADRQRQLSPAPPDTPVKGAGATRGGCAGGACGGAEGGRWRYLSQGPPRVGEPLPAPDPKAGRWTTKFSDQLLTPDNPTTSAATAYRLASVARSTRIFRRLLNRSETAIWPLLPMPISPAPRRAGIKTDLTEPEPGSPAPWDGWSLRNKTRFRES